MPSENLSLAELPYNLSQLNPKCPFLTQHSYAQTVTIRLRNVPKLSGEMPLSNTGRYDNHYNRFRDRRGTSSLSDKTPHISMTQQNKISTQKNIYIVVIERVPLINELFSKTYGTHLLLCGQYMIMRYKNDKIILQNPTRRLNANVSYSRLHCRR